MPEINLGSGDSDGSDSSSGGGGSTAGITDILEELEQVTEWAKENPQVAQMMGYDISALGGETMDTENMETDASVNDVSADDLLKLFQTLESQGYGEFSVKQVGNYIANNKEEVDNLIDENL